MSNSASDAALSALYQEMILDHYRRPRNKGTLEHADATVPMRNPLCGDELTLELAMDGDVIRDVSTYPDVTELMLASCNNRYTSVRLRPASRATSLTWPCVSFSRVIR